MDRQTRGLPVTTLACYGCKKTFPLFPEQLLALRQYLLTCPQCQRTQLFLTPERTGEAPLERPTAPVSIEGEISAHEPEFAAPPPAQEPPSAAPAPDDAPRNDLPQHDLVDDLKDFLRHELSESTAESQAVSPANDSAVADLQRFIEREYGRALKDSAPPAPISNPAPAQTAPIAPLFPTASRSANPKNADLSWVRVAIAVVFAAFDAALLRPFDLLATLHFAFGREWARAWKRAALIVHPLVGLALYVALWPVMTDGVRRVLLAAVFLTLAWSLIAWPLLGMRWLNRRFRGQISLVLVLTSSVVVAAAQGYLQIRLIFPWVQTHWSGDKTPALVAVQKPLDRWARQFQETILPPAPKTPQPETTPPSQNFARQGVPGVSAPSVQLSPEVLPLARAFLRTDLPENTQNEFLNLAAQVLQERKGLAALTGKPETVALALRDILRSDFIYLLRPEAIRGQHGDAPVEPREVKAPEQVSQDLLTETGFHNALSTLINNVKWRNIAPLHELLPAALQARITPTDLARLYAPVFATGEIFSMEYRVLGRSSDAAVLQIDYDMVPYIKIDPESVVFGSGFYDGLRQNNPVKVARFRYLFLPAGSEWRAVPFTPAVGEMVKTLMPGLQPPSEATDIAFITKAEKAPSNLVNPEIK